MELSQTVLGLKLLHDAGLSSTDKKLVMSEIDFKKKDDVYKKAKSRLAKYLTDLIGLSEATRGMKIKSGLITAEMEEVLVTKRMDKTSKKVWRKTKLTNQKKTKSREEGKTNEPAR